MTKAAELAKIISASGVVSGVGFTAGNAVLAEAELELLDGLTAGTAIASKVITTDANIDSTGMRNLTISGELDAATLDISGNVDIDGTLETDAFSIASTAVTSTAAELNILDGVTSTATELNLLDGVTSTTAELNILDGVTSTAAELNILDGVTSTTAELNILDGVTSTATELNLLDGVTSTTAELNILDGVTSTAAELNILDGVTASAADINLIDGITNGTVIASKAIITDSNKDITGGRNITISGELDAATLDISGDIDVDGTANLDVVDIDGAVDMATTLAVGGVVTANAGVVVDNITIDGTEIDLSSGNLTVDVDGVILLDADGGNVQIHDAGTEIARFTNNSSDFEIKVAAQDKDIRFKGNDGGAEINALTLDMSDAGTATFNHDIKLGDNGMAIFGAGPDLRIFHDGSNSYIEENGTGDLIVQTNGANFLVENTDGDDMIKAISDGAVEISHNNVKKFETTATGAKVSGGLVANSAIENSSGFSSDEFQVMAGTTSNQDSKHGGVFFSKHADSNSLLVGQHDTAFQSFVVKGSGDVLFQKTSATTAGAGTFFEVPTTASTMPVYLRFCKTYSGVREGISFNHSGSYVGGILFDNSSTTYATSSDYRLKENVVTDWDATTRLKQLKPSRFNFKADTDRTVDGFIAHEVSSIVPEAITGEKDAMAVETRYTEDDLETQGDNPTKSVGDVKTYSSTKINPQAIDQSKIVPLLTKALQEQQATIEALTARIVTLENA